MKRYIPALFLSLSACSAITPQATVMAPASRDWRTVATADDRLRLRNWRATFVDAVAAARAAGHGAEIDKEGALLEPDAALATSPISNGMYRCRVIKVGGKTPGMLDYVAYPYFSCRVQQERDLQGFAKLAGSQRPIGLIFPSDALRQVFLGTLVLGDERRAMQYGRDRERDVAGFVERVGTDRWRLIMPAPHFESQLDVMELVPVR